MTTPAGESSLEATIGASQTPDLLDDGHGDTTVSTGVVTPARPTRQLWSEIVSLQTEWVAKDLFAD